MGYCCCPFSGRELVCLAEGFAGLRFYPDAAWLEQLLAAVHTAGLLLPPAGQGGGLDPFSPTPPEPLACPSPLGPETGPGGCSTSGSSVAGGEVGAEELRRLAVALGSLQLEVMETMEGPRRYLDGSPPDTGPSPSPYPSP